MKNSLISILLLFMSLTTYGQNILIPRGVYTQVFEKWESDKDDYYKVTLDSNYQTMDVSYITLKDIYSFEKKKGWIFYSDKYGFYKLYLNDEQKKTIKKAYADYDFPCLKEDELTRKSSDLHQYFSDYYKKYNDSVKSAKEAEKERQRLESIKREREKHIQDSLSDDAYRKNHEDWTVIKVDKSIHCSACDESHKEVRIAILSINNDTIYYLHGNPDKKWIGYEFQKIHYTHIANLKNYGYNGNSMSEYQRIWKDSISHMGKLTNELADNVNGYKLIQFVENVRKAAPYGYIQQWGWNLNSAEGIEPSFSFMNMNAKTIKYIDFYFSVYNAVGDICPLLYTKGNVGHVRGVGPVEQFNTGSWSWDSATHYTTGDASNMKIQKLVITYMDKTTKIIPRAQIIIEDSEDDDDIY